MSSSSLSSLTSSIPSTVFYEVQITRKKYYSFSSEQLAEECANEYMMRFSEKHGAEFVHLEQKGNVWVCADVDTTVKITTFSDGGTQGE